MRTLPGSFLKRAHDGVDHRAGTFRSAVRLLDRGGAVGNFFIDQPRVDGGEQGVEIGEALAEVAIP
jgi:hypothetical protein